jgi:hypothetical protein
VIEDLAVVGDKPRKHVEAPGRALRVGEGRNRLRQREVLEKLDDVDAALLEHRSVLEVDHVIVELAELVFDRTRSPRQEARADAIGFGAKAQVQARRLELPLREILRRAQHLAAHELADLLPRKKAGLPRQLSGPWTAHAAEVEVILVAKVGREVRCHGDLVHPRCLARGRRRSNAAGRVIAVVHRTREARRTAASD